MKKIFIITGAGGFLGNNIIRKLQLNEENEIRALVLPGENLKSLEGLRCRIFSGDVTKKQTLTEIFDTPKDAVVFVIHCAAVVYIGSRYNAKVYDVNVNGTKNIIDKVLERQAKLVYVCSVHAIPESNDNSPVTEIYEFDPESVEGQYAKTKAETANYVLKTVREKNLNACIVFPSGIIGPYDFGNSHTTQLFIDFADGRLKACVKGGYDFADVRDVADGVINACLAGKKGECYILSNRFVSIKELLDMISEVRNTKKLTTILPMWIAKFTAPLSELYYSILKQTPLYTKYSLYTLKPYCSFSNEKAKRELGFNNRDLRETVRDTVRWLEENNRIKKYDPR